MNKPETISPRRASNRRVIRSMLKRGRSAINASLCWTANQNMRAALRWIAEARELTGTDKARFLRAWHAVAAAAPASWHMEVDA